MEIDVLPILSVALLLFGLILIGGIAGKAGFLGRDATGTLNMFLVYLSLPAVLFQGIAYIPPTKLTNGGRLGGNRGAHERPADRRQCVHSGQAVRPGGNIHAGAVLISTLASFATLSVLLTWFA